MIDWTEEMDALLGTDTDASVARQLDLHLFDVRDRREELDKVAYGVEPSDELSEVELRKVDERGVGGQSQKRWYKAQKITWTPEMDALVGTMPHKELALRLGISVSSICLRNKDLRVPRRRRGMKWTSEMELLLGQAIDADVAKELGIPKNRVRRRRLELGIPKFNRGPKWTPGMDALLGTDMDRVVARNLKIPEHQVRARRVKLGVRSWRRRDPGRYFVTLHK